MISHRARKEERQALPGPPFSPLSLVPGRRSAVRQPGRLSRHGVISTPSAAPTPRLSPAGGSGSPPQRGSGPRGAAPSSLGCVDSPCAFAFGRRCSVLAGGHQRVGGPPGDRVRSSRGPPNLCRSKHFRSRVGIGQKEVPSARVRTNITQCVKRARVGQGECGRAQTIDPAARSRAKRSAGRMSIPSDVRRARASRLTTMRRPTR
jgi:hypothetical protein